MSLFRRFLDWFNGRDKLTKAQLKEVVSDLAPPQGAPQVRTLQDLRAAQEIRALQDLVVFADEVRKTLAIMKTSAQKRVDNDAVLKKSIDSLYVEVGNLADKVRAFAPREKDKQ